MEFIQIPEGVHELTLTSVKPFTKKATSKAGNEFMQEGFRFVFCTELDGVKAYTTVNMNNYITDKANLPKFLSLLVAMEDKDAFIQHLEALQYHEGRASMLDQLRGFHGKSIIEHNLWNEITFVNMKDNQIEGEKLSITAMSEKRIWDSTAFENKGGWANKEVDNSQAETDALNNLGTVEESTEIPFGTEANPVGGTTAGEVVEDDDQIPF